MALRIVNALLLWSIIEYSFALAGGPTDAPELINRVAGSTVRIEVKGVDISDNAVDNQGSGFFVSSDGWILTADHVVAEDSQHEAITWKTIPGQTNPVITVEAVGLHGTLESIGNAVVTHPWPHEDLAALRIAGKNYAPVVCTSSGLVDDMSLRALGWRAGRQEYDPLGPGTLTPYDGADKGRRKVQNLTAYAGDSGGPVFNDNGAVIGVLTAGYDTNADPGPSATFFTALGDVDLPLSLRTCFPEAQVASGLANQVSVASPGALPSPGAPTTNQLKSLSPTVQQLQRATAYSKPTANILWVDPHPANNVGLQYAFQSLGMIVVSVQNDKAIGLAFQMAKRFDVVITNMARKHSPLGGLQTVSLIASKYPNVPVIIYSGTYGEQHRNEPPTPPVVLATNITQDVFNKVVDIARARTSNFPISDETRSDVSHALSERTQRGHSEGAK